MSTELKGKEQELKEQLAKIQAEHVLVIGVETDMLFPLHQQRELANQLKMPGRELEFLELPSIQGHDSFLLDVDRFNSPIESFFK